MTQDEFIAEHGKELWRLLVEPLQQRATSAEVRQNANILVYDMLLRWRELMAFTPTETTRESKDGS